MSFQAVRTMLRVRGLTYSCPRCGQVFLTEVQRDMHYLQCGSAFAARFFKLWQH